MGIPGVLKNWWYYVYWLYLCGVANFNDLTWVQNYHKDFEYRGTNIFTLYEQCRFMVSIFVATYNVGNKDPYLLVSAPY